MASTCNRIVIILVCLFFQFSGNSQTVYYPDNSSHLLRSTATDAALLLQKAISGSVFNTQAYSSLPSTGIIFVYDSSITDNQYFRVETNGSSFLKFSAAEDNGLVFGIYQYLSRYRGLFGR